MTQNKLSKNKIKGVVIVVVVIVVLAVTLTSALMLNKPNTPNNTNNPTPTNNNKPTSVTLSPYSQTIEIPQAAVSVAQDAQFTLDVSDVSPVQSIAFHTGIFSSGHENIITLLPNQLSSNQIDASTTAYQFYDNAAYENAGTGVYNGYVVIIDVNGNTYTSNTIAVYVQGPQTPPPAPTL